MGTNRSKRKHRYHGIALDPSIEKFFWDGSPERNSPGWSLRVSRFFGGHEIQDAWEQHKDFLMDKWQAEGREETPWILREGAIYAN